MSNIWTVQNAKAQLAELLRRARAGDPQRIGVTDACIVLSEKDWAALQPTGLGAWLVDSAPKGDDIELPVRRSHRGDPFARDSRADDANGAKRR
jgi:prevent-host-death family protein